MNKLLKHITDSIVEQQLKLGYEKETVRLYYPFASLTHLVDSDCQTTEELNDLLDQFCEEAASTLGKVTYSHKGDRYEISIPPQGSEYIHQTNHHHPFLADLISLVSSHQCTKESVISLFNKYSSNVCHKDFDGEDFDFVIYFTDHKIDDDYYCFKNEAGHLIYHRFSAQDYVEL